MRPHVDQKKSPQNVDDSSDTCDTIEFLLKHVANNNGKVGIWGISYPGFYTSASIIDSHPALVAASPQAPMTDLFMGDVGYHGGAFMLSANFGFYSSFHPQKSPTILSGCGQHCQSRYAISAGLELAVQRPVQERYLRRLLEGARLVAAHEECALRSACGWRVVRRGGCGRAIPHFLCNQ
jgi:predicted acyl esterase